MAVPTAGLMRDQGRPLLYSGEHRAPTPLWMVALGLTGLVMVCYVALALG